MIFEVPLAIIFGFFTFFSLFVAVSLGIAFHRYRKNVFKYHRLFAFVTSALAVLHLIFVMLLLSGTVL